MKSMIAKTVFALGLSVASLASAAVTGNSVSVQFVGNRYTGDGFDLTPTSVAGFGTYASANFNVFDLSAGDSPANGFNEVIGVRPTNAVLRRDINGVSTAAASTLTVTGFDEITITGSDSTNAGKLFKRPLINNVGGGTGSVSVTNVGYTQYSAIVYLTKGARDKFGNNSPPLSINGTAITNYVINGYGFDDGENGAPNPTVYRNAQTTQVGNANYVVVTGLTAANFNVTLGAPLDGTDAGIVGFTLLNTAVPEPTTLGLVAGAGLLALRRRSR